MDMEKDAEGGVCREENERVDIVGVRGNEKRLVTVTESYKTDDNVYWPRDEGRRSGKRDDACMRRGRRRNGRPRKKVDVHVGDRLDGDGPGRGERSGEEPEGLEVADHDSR